MTEALAVRLTVPQLVATYEQAERDIRAGFALVRAAEEALTRAFAVGDYSGITVSNHYDRVRFAEPDETLENVRRTVWQLLIERMELKQFMSVRAWEELCAQVKNGEPPPITEELVSGMARQYAGSLDEMLEEAVTEVFEFLRPHNTRYKTNTQFEVGKRVILKAATRSWNGTMEVSHYWDQRMTALENVMTSLDGKGARTKGHYSELAQTLRGARAGEVRETPYFRLRAHKNGSLHIEFKRLDLVARLNKIAGGARLRPAAAG